jgi:hypothetical protein
MPTFARHIGIDYSGARTPTASLKGLRIYLAEGYKPPVEVPPPPSPPRKYWTRRGIAEWLVDRLAVTDRVWTVDELVDAALDSIAQEHCARGEEGRL